MLSAVEECLGRQAGILARYAAAAILAALANPAHAAELLPVNLEQDRLPEQAEARARAEAAELVREMQDRMEADEDIADWTRIVTENALSRAAGAAEESVTAREDSPIAAELANAQGAAQVLVFLSLSVPETSWRQWAAEAVRAGAPLVLRGPSPAGLQATVAEIGNRLGGHAAGVAIDPRLFRLFGVERAPAVVVVPGGSPACASRGCADDPPPPFDRVTGNIGLAAALAAVAAEGEAGRGVAREYLERMGVRP